MSQPSSPAAFTPPTIAHIVGCPLANVQTAWPGIQAALAERGQTDRACMIATLATIGTEVPAFLPIPEFGSDAYFTQMYEHRADLGNNQPGDGARYKGRGYIQLT